MTEHEPAPGQGVSRREGVAWMLVGALALALIGVTMRAVSPDAPAAASDDPAVGQARDAVVGLTVRAIDGSRALLAPPGRPAVLMVNSITCGYCKEALREIARRQGSGGVPQLRVVTLEGADEGQRMLADAGVRNAFMAGPDGQEAQVLLTFRIPGTPVFARTDATGRIVETIPGYPGPQLVDKWLPVMQGQ
jgi:hypothetical protein